MASYERYKSLVQEAWQHYCQGDQAGMARSLENSLEYTPYLRSETISDWLNQFIGFSQAGEQKLDVLFLVDIPNWNQLIKLALNLGSPQDCQLLSSCNNPTIVSNKIIKDIPLKLNYNSLYNFLLLSIKKYDLKTIKPVLKYIEENKFVNQSTLFRCCYFVTKTIDIDFAFSYGYRYLKLNPDDKKFANVLLNISYRLGDLEKAETISKTINKYTIPTITENSILLEKIMHRFDEIIDSQDLNFDVTTIQKYISQNSWVKKVFFNKIKQETNQDKKNHELEKMLELTQDVFFAQKLAYNHRNYGSLKKSLSLLKYIENTSGVKDSITKLVEGEMEILEKGFPGIDISLPILKKHSSNKYNNTLNILYVIHNSLPYKSVGYAVRSHYITQGLVKQKVNISAVTRLGFPNDEIDLQQFPLCDHVDQVAYNRLKSLDVFYNKSPFPQYLSRYTESLLNFAYKYQPTILHSASNFINGIATNHVAKILGIPSIYEVRGLWEITRISKDPYYENSDLFKMMKKMEVEAAMNATAVVTLTEALKIEMVRRGIPSDKISVISNGADPQRFKPLTRDEKLETLFKYKNKIVIGYIGSIVQYEGIEYILEASAILKAKGFNNFSVLIVGDGNHLDKIKLLCSQLNLKDVVTFTGRVSHEEIYKYYSLVDIMTYPRKSQPVCEMVSPLKPFEAMSMEKCVVSSDVAALTEIVNDGVTGLLHRKDDVADLARILEILINDNSLRIKLGKTARQWIKKEKNWEIISRQFIQIYNSLI